MTVGAEFVADLERVRAALSHVVPTAAREVLHECIRRTLRACERRKVGSGKARTRTAPVTTGGERPGEYAGTGEADPNHSSKGPFGGLEARRRTLHICR